MKLKRIGILVVAAAVLVVMAGGNAWAYSYTNTLYSSLSESSLSPPVASASWNGATYENINMNKYDPDYALSCKNHFTNNAVDIQTNLFWIGQGFNGNGILAQSYYYDIHNVYISYLGSREYSETVYVDKSKDAGTYGYDQGHTYYPSNYPWYYYAYSPSQMAQKGITLTT